MREELKKKRVLRACDTCRVKKAKCDGSKPCSRCLTDNQVCTYAHRRKQSERVFTNDYVELLESKLQNVLKSFMFLVSELGESRDYSKYVPGPNTPINTVIEKLNKEIRSLKDTSEIDGKVAQLMESSRSLNDPDAHDADYGVPHKIETPKPKARRGRPPKHSSPVISTYSPIARPEPKPEPLTPPPVPLLPSEELDKTKNSLIMNWKNPSADSFDLFRASFDDSYIPPESLYAENLVLNDELLSATPPAQLQAPDFDHPVEYDQPMEDFDSPLYVNDAHPYPHVEIKSEF